jgi:hypothetical protein
MTTTDTEFGMPDDDEELDLEALVLRRRRRVSVLTAALVLGLVGAAAFIGGVEVQKHTGSSSSSGGGSAAASFASRFRGAGGATTGGTTPGGAAGAGGAFAGGATIGTVTVIKGSTLYVTDTGGNTVKVTTSAAARISKTVSTNLQAIHPGDTVVVGGTQQKNGDVAADTISVGAAGGGFGGGGTGFGGSSSGGGTGFGGGGGGSGG